MDGHFLFFKFPLGSAAWPDGRGEAAEEEHWPGVRGRAAGLAGSSPAGTLGTSRPGLHICDGGPFPAGSTLDTGDGWGGNWGQREGEAVWA